MFSSLSNVQFSHARWIFKTPSQRVEVAPSYIIDLNQEKAVVARRRRMVRRKQLQTSGPAANRINTKYSNIRGGFFGVKRHVYTCEDYYTVNTANFGHIFNFIPILLYEIKKNSKCLLYTKRGLGLVRGIQTIKTQWFRPLLKTVVSEISKAIAKFGH